MRYTGAAGEQGVRGERAARRRADGDKQMRPEATRSRLALTLIVVPALGCALLWVIATSSDNPTLIGMATAIAVLAPAALAFAANSDLPRRKQLGYAFASALLTLVAIAVVGAILVASLGEIGPPN